jgi:chromosome segregation protein
MTARLTRLRIAGFKSFAEPVSLDILPGLTGIVGPNGCGKSNVVEALRWAMGETSAKSLRGGEMDDVIFAGTTARASRNLAEVTITLERSEDALPAPFEAEAELQLTRRIERGAGSGYRGNGREMRARDVQTMFADLASGARSSAMVSQGRVAAIVNARPEERRQILEEAAGITGLHARRHEAELKLRAAEQNSGKAEDLRAQLETSREGLRKQARQASRYRNISSLVRGAEAELLAVQFARAEAALTAARATQAQAQDGVAAAEAACAAAAAQVTAAEAALPAPRAAEAAARSTLERARLEAENVAEEAARAEAALQAAEQLLADLQADAEDAGRAEADAVAACARLGAEADKLRARLAALPDDLTAARQALSDAEEAALAAEHEASVATREAAETLAAAAQARQARAEAGAKAGESAARLAQADRDYAAAEAAMIGAEALEAAAARRLAAEQALASARADEAAAAQADADAATGLVAANAVLARAVVDARHAAERRAEAAARAEKLGAAHKALSAQLEDAAGALVPAASIDAARQAAELAAAALEGAESAVQEAEKRSVAATQAHLRAERLAQDAAEDTRRAEAARDAAGQRLARLTGEAERLGAALAQARAALAPDECLDAAARAAAEAEAGVAAAADALSAVSALRLEAESTLATARAAAAAAAAEAARLAAEIEGLRAALVPQGQAGESATDSVHVPAEWEAAFAAGLEDAQDFALTPTGEKFWRTLPDLAPGADYPGTTRLDTVLEAPACLRRALSRIAVMDDGTDGEALHASLAPGDTLVSRAGDVWRWDGRVVRAGAPSAASIRLRQRRRLRESQAGLADATLAAERGAAEAAVMAARLAELDAETAAARVAREESEGRLRTAQADLAKLTANAAQARTQAEAAERAADQAALDRGEAEAAWAAAEAHHAGLASPEAALAAAQGARGAAGAATATLEAARRARVDARAALADAQEAFRRVQASGAEAATRLQSLRQQSARLADERAEAEAALAEAEAAEAGLPNLASVQAASDKARDQARLAKLASDTARAARESAQLALDEARADAAGLETAQVQAATRFRAEENLLARARADHAAAALAQESAEAACHALADPDALAARAAAAAERAAAQRGALAAAAALVTGLDGEQARADARLPALDTELAAWQARCDQAGRRRHAVLLRLDAADKARQELADAPALLADGAARSGAALAEAEAAHAAQTKRLEEADAALRGAALAQRDADARLAQLREAFARQEGAEAAAVTALQGVLARAAERLGVEAELPEVSDASDSAEEKARRKWERLQRERDEMGPVNLRADIELEEIDTRLQDIDREREELATAIAKLRGAIGHLNREGRERLSAVFTEVDKHFRALFTRMMGGGRAHLALTGSDDPLTAGLEIYAEPPGKKLSTLSLLSGGEQALTALSLIFAVFRCTPAPVAVLDEVDAPLDDANVERLCALLEDVVRETGTRFLVVTHHQMTMSRMDRLFGVTMQERGVSRLLSVDLRRAAEMVEPTQAVAA